MIFFVEMQGENMRGTNLRKEEIPAIQLEVMLRIKTCISEAITSENILKKLKEGRASKGIKRKW